MTIRLLLADEYHLLDQIPAEHRADLNPVNSLVAVGVDGGRIVGRCAAVNLPHIECLWVDESERGGTLAHRLERCIEAELKRCGASKAIAFAVDEKMEDYLRRIGFERFATAWIKEI